MTALQLSPQFPVAIGLTYIVEHSGNSLAENNSSILDLKVIAIRLSCHVWYWTLFRKCVTYYLYKKWYIDPSRTGNSYYDNRTVIFVDELVMTDRYLGISTIWLSWRYDIDFCNCVSCSMTCIKRFGDPLHISNNY